MNLQEQMIAGGKRFCFSGNFTFSDNQQFKAVLELADDKTMSMIELDFTGLTFIDSAGLGMLLLLRDRCQSNHVAISIIGASGQVEKVMLISKFDQLFNMRS